MPYVNVRGIQLAYDREGAGRPIVMVHGAVQDSTSWRYSLPYFARWYDAIAIDMPGHGKSQFAPSGPVQTVDLFAEYICEFIETLGLDRPIVMGHSLAGAISLRVGVGHSEMIAAIVNVDGTAVNNARNTGYRGGMLDYVAINPKDWMETTFYSLFGRNIPVDRKRELSLDARRVSPDVIVGDLRAYTTCDFVDQLPRITVPVLSVAGEDDWSCTPDMVKRSHDAITAPKQFVLWPSIGHFPHIEQPQVFNETVHRFLSGHGL